MPIVKKASPGSGTSESDTKSTAAAAQPLATLRIIKSQLEEEILSMPLMHKGMTPHELTEIWERDWGVLHADAIRFEAPPDCESKWLHPREDAVPPHPAVVTLHCKGRGSVLTALVTAFKKLGKPVEVIRRGDGWEPPKWSVAEVQRDAAKKRREADLQRLAEEEEANAKLSHHLDQQVYAPQTEHERHQSNKGLRDPDVAAAVRNRTEFAEDKALVQRDPRQEQGQKLGSRQSAKADRLEESKPSRERFPDSSAKADKLEESKPSRERFPDSNLVPKDNPVTKDDPVSKDNLDPVITNEHEHVSIEKPAPQQRMMDDERWNQMSPEQQQKWRERQERQERNLKRKEARSGKT